MSTPTDEIAIDIDAADAKAVAEAAKKGANGALLDDAPAIEIEKGDPESQKADKSAITPDEGLEKLKKQLEEERTGRLAAERQRDEATRGEVAARTEVQTSQLDLVNSAIERTTQNKAALKAKLSAAYTAQDFDAVAEVQSEMADNAANLAQLQAGKKALESAPKPVPRAPADPVEQFAAALSPASATWVRAHPEFVRDSHKNRQMIAAHELALARGLKADTPEYFASVEKTLDLTAPVVARVDPAADASADAAQAVGGRAAPAAAPVSRSNGAHGNRPGVVKLTPAEVEAAGNSGLTLEEYARNKVALRKEGKLS